MTTPSASHPYRVQEAERFAVQWRRAVRLGYINPMVDPAGLMQIKELLAHSPYTMRQLPPNIPANRRRVQINPGVWLWYSIIEDDRTVLLESVTIVAID